MCDQHDRRETRDRDDARERWPVTFLPGAEDSGCQLVTAPKFSPDGMHFTAVHASCVNDARRGEYVHVPTGAGTRVANESIALAKPMFENDGTIIAVGVTASATNGLVVIQNGAVTGYIQPPAGASFRDVAESPDGSVVVLSTLDGNLVLTSDFVTYTPLVSDGRVALPTF